MRPSPEISADLIELGAIAMAGSKAEWDRLSPIERNNTRIRFSRGLHKVLSKLRLDPPASQVDGEIGLTPPQRRLLNIIAEHIERTGSSPSIRELKAYMNRKSTQSVHWLVMQLVARGYLRHESHTQRSIQIIKRGE